MSETIREWTESITYRAHLLRETELRLIIRDRPRWLPERLWRWAIGKLLVLKERDLPAHNNQERNE